MRKIFELFCIKFALFVYTEYVYEDMSIYTKWAKVILYLPLLYRAFVIWLFCPIFLPEYFFKQSNIYKEMKKAQNSPEYNEMITKIMGTLKF